MIIVFTRAYVYNEDNPRDNNDNKFRSNLGRGWGELFKVLDTRSYYNLMNEPFLK